VTPLHRLQLAVALAHAVPGSVLRMRGRDGQTVVVADHPAADLDACAMRRVVHASARPDGPDLAPYVASIELGGSLDDLGGGVVRVVVGGVEQRWIPSLLGPRRLVDLLVGVGDATDDTVGACVKPDPDLGVSLVVIAPGDGNDAREIDAVAATVAAAIFVEELCCAAVAEHLGATPRIDGRCIEPGTGTSPYRGGDGEHRAERGRHPGR
jgi:hypothetical protein